MAIKGFIFDMDGTMLDTEQISFAAYDTAAKELGVQVDYATKLTFLGLSGAEIGERFYALFGRNFDYPTLRLRKIEIQNDIIARTGVPIKPGLIELLTFAKAQGISLAVATSTTRERAIALLEGAGVLSSFAVILCGNEVTHGKPHPEIFLAAAQKLMLPPKDCVVFEDSRNGVLAASNAGMYTVLVPDLLSPDEEMRKAANVICKDLFEATDHIKSLIHP